MMHVNPDKCIACKLCINDCPVSDIILSEGKAKVKNERCFDCGHCVAICPKDAVTSEIYDMSQVKPYDKETFTLSPENLLNAIKFRRSVRHFKDQKVEKEKLEQIIEAGRYTQTATNSQDVSYVVVTEKIGQLRDMTYETLHAMAQHLTSDPHTAPKLLNYAHMWLHMYAAYKENPKNDRIFFNAPAIILAISPNTINGTLASSNMELMTNALGLGTFFSGFFTVAAENNKLLQKVVGLSETDKIVTCMVIGYPNVNYQRTAPRKAATVSWQ